MRANRTLKYFAARVGKLPHLSSREKDILIRRVNGETLDKIGSEFGITEGRVRQIEKGALTKVDSKFIQQLLLKD